MRIDHAQRVTALLIGCSTIAWSRTGIEWDTIHDVKRLRRSRERVGTTYHDTHTTTRSTIALVNLHTGHLTLHTMGQVKRTTLHQVFTLQGTQGTTQVALLHRTITYDYDFIHHLGIFLHRNGYLRLTSHIDDLGLHTHTRHLDTCLTFWQSNGEVSVHIGNSSSTSAFHDNACTNQRLIVHATIQDGTRQFALGEKLAAHDERHGS